MNRRSDQCRSRLARKNRYAAAGGLEPSAPSGHPAPSVEGRHGHSGRDGAGQLALGFVELGRARKPTNTACWSPPSRRRSTLAQLYRDRADSEDPFDELKNQWGWGASPPAIWPAASSWRASSRSSTTGGTCSALAEPDKHLEAITSRPAVVFRYRGTEPPCQTDHAQSCQFARQGRMGGDVLSGIARFFASWSNGAVDGQQRWRRILAQPREGSSMAVSSGFQLVSWLPHDAANG